MTHKNRIFEMIYYTIIGILSTYSIASIAIASTMLEIDESFIFAYAAIFVMTLYLVFFNRYTTMAFLGGAVIAVLIVLFTLWREAFEAEWFVRLCQYVSNIVRFITDNSAYNQGYDRVLSMGIVLLIAIVVASTVRTHFGFYIITILGVIMQAIPAIKMWGKSEAATVIFLFCFVVLLLEKLSSYHSERRRDSFLVNSSYAVLILPLAAAILAGSLLAPSPDVGETDVIARIRDADMFFDEKAVRIFSFSEEREELGGPIMLGEEFVMEVEAKLPVYLSGSIMDSYTGSAWLNTEDDYKRLAPMADGSFNTEVAAEENSLFSNYFGVYPEKITIAVYDRRTRKVFSPARQLNAVFDDSINLSMNPKGSARTNRLIATSYTQSHLPVNRDRELVALLIKEKSTGAVTDPYQLERYLQLPKNLPARVGDKAQEVAGGGADSFTKMILLESYLKQFPYTYTPSEVPEGVDFVDHFLFEEQQGYCVYYASALAVMGRTLGIPTRYVEGFAMPYLRNVNGNFSVTNAQAHAWVEAYFPGVGWVEFEPTGSYDGGGQIPPDALPSYKKPENNLGEEAAPPKPEDLPSNEPVDPQGGTQPDDPAGSASLNGAGEGEASKPSIGRVLLIILIILLVLGGLVLAGKKLIDRYNRRIEQLEKLTNKDKVDSYFRYILNITKAMEAPIKHAETPIEYGKRMEQELEIAEFGKLTRVFSAASYGKDQVPDTDVEVIKNCYEKLVTRLYRKQFKPKFLIQRYLLGSYYIAD